MIIVDSYFSHLNGLFEASLLTVLTQGRRFLGYHPCVCFQVKLLQLIIEVKEVSIDLVDFDHGFASVCEARVVRVGAIASLEARRT